MSVSDGVDRRRFLKISAAASMAGAAVVLEPVLFSAPAAAAGTEETRVVTGHLPAGSPDWVYLPVDVPRGVREIAVSYSYDKPAPPPGQAGNALDIGIFDPSGYELGNARGFRGWSGGFRTSFAISRSAATPGYLPGPVEPGRWHGILGPYMIVPAGLDYRVEITLRYGEPGPAFVPDPAPERATGRGRAWYRGDMHLHTVHSDGAYPIRTARSSAAPGNSATAGWTRSRSGTGRGPRTTRCPCPHGTVCWWRTAGPGAGCPRSAPPTRTGPAR